MRVLIQRVKNASVTVNKELISLIDNGLLVFIGIGEDDNCEDIEWLTKKIAELIYPFGFVLSMYCIFLKNKKH